MSSLPSNGDVTVAVLGDSFSVESSASTGPEWPQILSHRLGWAVSTDASDSRGYVNPGNDESLTARVAPTQKGRPDVIIVAAGFADLGVYPTARITDAAETAISELARDSGGARVVVISPFSPGQPGPMTRQLSGGLKRIAADHRVSYVDATHWLPYGENLLSSDGIHPTEKGQQRIADEMLRAVTRLGIVRQPPAAR